MLIVHANSELVDVRDGTYFEKSAWTLAPEAKPDIYTSSKKGEIVTFPLGRKGYFYIIK